MACGALLDPVALLLVVEDPAHDRPDLDLLGQVDLAGDGRRAAAALLLVGGALTALAWRRFQREWDEGQSVIAEAGQ